MYPMYFKNVQYTLLYTKHVMCVPMLGYVFIINLQSPCKQKETSSKCVCGLRWIYNCSLRPRTAEGPCGGRRSGL